MIPGSGSLVLVLWFRFSGSPVGDPLISEPRWDKNLSPRVSTSPASGWLFETATRPRPLSPENSHSQPLQTSCLETVGQPISSQSLGSLLYLIILTIILIISSWCFSVAATSGSVSTTFICEHFSPRGRHTTDPLLGEGRGGCVSLSAPPSPEAPAQTGSRVFNSGGDSSCRRRKHLFFVFRTARLRWQCGRDPTGTLPESNRPGPAVRSGPNCLRFRNRSSRPSEAA